jgi:DNA replication regulator DPB11
VSTTTSTPFSRATSVDSTATHGNCVEYPPYSNSATSKNPTAAKANQDGDKQIDTDELEQIEKFRHAANGDRVEEMDAPPPPTQLLYEDPESREYKKRIMARMLGESVDERVKGKGRERVATDGWEVGERPRRRGKPQTDADVGAGAG